VAGNHGRFAWRQFGLDDVEICSTDATMANAHEDFSLGRLRIRDVRKHQWIGLDRAGFFEEASSHGLLMFAAFV